MVNKEDVERVEWLHSEQYSAAGDIFGKPQKTARIGDEYQAQIPSVFHEMKTVVENEIEFGLPIPVTWVHNQRKNKKKTEKFEKGKSSISPNGLLAVPCSSGEEKSWSVIEHESFLLGLYIFGKNLRVVNKFVGNKGMQNVIAYYYGKFYRSSEHKKWSIYRKKRIRKSFPGKKFFKGWRRQELLSRLLPKVTDECKTRLAQVSSTFDEGKLTFEKYIFSLRDAVGIDLLTEAVAIGNEKRDLTTKTRRRLKNKKLDSKNSSLKTEEIVNILKNRIGLSKGRLNDIFWEAVWPRLLAKGWHSEENKNYVLQNSKDSLVFLAPGVEKFSRRSLEKGFQYFDSFSDILNKIASDPQLLEQELDQEKLSDDSKQDLMKRDTTEDSQNEDVKMDLSADLKPVRKLKVVFKRKEKQQNVNSITTNEKSEKSEKSEDEDMEQDLKNRRVFLVSEGNNGQRQSRRNRPLTIKALEALENGFLETKKKKRAFEGGTRRRVRGKTALVSNCGIQNRMDGVFNGSSHMVSESPK